MNVKRLVVTSTDGKTVAVVDADTIDTDSGHLFLFVGGQTVAAFAEGTWASVIEDKPQPDTIN